MNKIKSVIVKKLCEQLEISPFGLDMENGDVTLALFLRRDEETKPSTITTTTISEATTSLSVSTSINASSSVSKLSPIPPRQVESLLWSSDALELVRDRCSLHSIVLEGFLSSPNPSSWSQNEPSRPKLSNFSRVQILRARTHTFELSVGLHATLSLSFPQSVAPKLKLPAYNARFYRWYDTPFFFFFICFVS
jgi:hypothetical protein